MNITQQLPINIIKRAGPLLSTTQFNDTKDPCPVFDGKMWHIYGSGGQSGAEVWKILHATSDSIEGPWSEQLPVVLDGVEGDHVAAPGVVKDEKEQLFHMFVQRDFLALDGTIEHLTSADGHYFKKLNTSLASVPNSDEAGIYDPHPAEIAGQKYLVYAGSPSFTFTGTYYVGRPEIFLAKSKTNTWYGPWERAGKILSHIDVALHHNQLDDPDYEWGLEGPQLIELPNGKILLSAVCFLPKTERGYRQRVFFALANKIQGPYTSLGPIIHPQDNEWEKGETGHAAGIVHEDKLALFYQARCTTTPWRYGLALVDINSFANL